MTADQMIFVQALFLVGSTQINDAKMTGDFVAWIAFFSYGALALGSWELSLEPPPLPNFVLARVVHH